LNERSVAYANKKRSMEPPLRRGDKVYLLRKHIKTKRLSDKLDFKKLGPFKVVEKVGTLNFKLQLPKGLRLYPVFYISLLEPIQGNVLVAFDSELQLENDLDVYEVEKILDTRTIANGQ
jgi:hypothetical protein